MARGATDSVAVADARNSDDHTRDYQANTIEKEKRSFSAPDRRKQKRSGVSAARDYSAVVTIMRFRNSRRPSVR
jgi:hypothetical protein